MITGEGRLDSQSLHGKTPIGVARVARAAGVPVVALAGSLGEGYQAVYEAGIEAAFSLTSGPQSLEQAMHGAAGELTPEQLRLEFFYRRHAAWDERYGLYPVLRVDRDPR